MRLAVIADVHGNADALTATLADIRLHAPDAIINLGDCFSGPLDVARTAELLDGAGITLTVRGNHDRLLLDPPAMDTWDRAAHPRLAPATFDWLATLPANAILGDVFCCHATPYDDLTFWMETFAPPQPRQRESLSRIIDRAAGVTQSLMLCGHTHIARAVSLPDGRMIVNPGSVGCPGFHDDTPVPYQISAGTPHAAYALVDHGPQGWSVSHRLIPYDRSGAIAMARAAGFDDWVSALSTGWVAG